MSLTEFWNDGFSELGKFGFIGIVICVLTYFLLSDKHPIAALVICCLVFLSAIVKVYDYFGGGRKGAGMVFAWLFGGSLINLYIRWMKDNIRILDIAICVISAIIAFPLLGIITL